MDLKAYYQRIRELERGFGSEAVVLASLDTPDGGKAGVLTEAPAHVAARMIVGGRARAATAEESAMFRKQTGEAQRVALEREPVRRIQVTKK